MNERLTSAVTISLVLVLLTAVLAAVVAPAALPLVSGQDDGEEGPLSDADLERLEAEIKPGDVLHGHQASHWPLLQTLTEDGALVNSIAYSPDGSKIAYGGANETVYIHDTDSWALETTLTEAGNWIETISFSPDGSELAYGGRDNNVYIHETDSWSLETTLSESGGGVGDIAYLPDGSKLAYAEYTGSGGSLYIHETNSWSLETTLDPDQGDVVNTVSFSPDGSQVAFGSSEDDVFIHTVGGAWPREEQLTETSGDTHIRSVTYSPAGDQVAYGAGNNVYIHDTGSWALETTLTESADTILGVSYAPDGSQIAYGGDDNDMYVHSTSDWSLETTLTEASGAVYSVTYAPGGSQVAYGSLDGNAYVHGTEGISLGPDGHEFGEALRFDLDEEIEDLTATDEYVLAAAGEAGALALNRTTYSVEWRDDDNSSYAIDAGDGNLTYDVDGGQVRTLNLTDFGEVDVSQVDPFDADTLEIEYSPDGGAVAAGTSSGRIRIAEAGPWTWQSVLVSDRETNDLTWNTSTTFSGDDAVLLVSQVDWDANEATGHRVEWDGTSWSTTDLGAGFPKIDHNEDHLQMGTSPTRFLQQFEWNATSQQYEGVDQEGDFESTWWHDVVTYTRDGTDHTAASYRRPFDQDQSAFDNRIWFQERTDTETYERFLNHTAGPTEMQRLAYGNVTDPDDPERFVWAEEDELVIGTIGDDASDTQRLELTGWPDAVAIDTNVSVGSVHQISFSGGNTTTSSYDVYIEDEDVLSYDGTNLTGEGIGETTIAVVDDAGHVARKDVEVISDDVLIEIDDDHSVLEVHQDEEFLIYSRMINPTDEDKTEDVELYINGTLNQTKTDRTAPAGLTHIVQFTVDADQFDIGAQPEFRVEISEDNATRNGTVLDPEEWFSIGILEDQIPQPVWIQDDLEIPVQVQVPASHATGGEETFQVARNNQTVIVENRTRTTSGVETFNVTLNQSHADDGQVHIRVTANASWDEAVINVTEVEPIETYEELVLEVENFMHHNETQEYAVYRETYANATDTRLSKVDVTDAAQVTSSNTSVVEVFESNHTLASTADVTVNDIATINASYIDLNTSEDVTVANVTPPNLPILPPIWRVPAIAGDTVIQVLFVATLVGVVCTYVSTAFGGLGASWGVVFVAWLAGWFPLGMVITMSIFVGFVGFNLVTNVDYTVRR